MKETHLNLADPVEAKALSGTVDAIIVVLGLDAWQKPTTRAGCWATRWEWNLAK